MTGFVMGADRAQSSLLPESLEDWVDESNPVRVIDAFVDALDLRDLGFDGVDPANLEVYSRSRAPSQQLAPPVNATSNKP